MSKYVVIYDSCILYSFTLRNIFVELAGTELFQAKWTEDIHKEWIGSFLKNNPSVSKPKLERLKGLLNGSVTDCLVQDYHSLIPNLNLPDPGDAHVLGAAIRCNAQAIVTNNLKDFPKEVLNHYDLEAINPDTFLTLQMDLSPGKVLSAIKKSRQRLGNPAYSPEEYLNCLRRKGLINSATIMEEYAELI